MGDIARIVENLWNTFDSGATKPIQYRKNQLRQLMNMLKENRTEFEEALAKDLGKSKSDSMLYEINISINEIVHQIDHIDEYSR